MTLEEITIYELTRIGDKLEGDFLLLQESVQLSKGDKELSRYLKVYQNLVNAHNMFIRESNSYLPDHRVKYYRDIKTNELSYSKVKIQPMGFI